MTRARKGGEWVFGVVGVAVMLVALAVGLDGERWFSGFLAGASVTLLIVWFFDRRVEHRKRHGGL